MAMSIASPSAANDPLIEMNTTPLIDVLLVLLIMFIVTVPVMTHSTTLAVGGTGAPELPPIVNVDIDFDGTVLWNGKPVESLERLEAYFRHEAGQPLQPDIQVRPDRRATYDVVARVLAMAQRNGMKRIGVSHEAID